MVHAYHVIWGTYGFWLPNDPRGSWSDFVGSWELAFFGRATKSLERINVDIEEWARWRAAALQALLYPAVVLSQEQCASVGQGFANAVAKSGYTMWACSIMSEHVHLVIARHGYEVEQIANLLKGEATKQLKRDQLHPQARHVDGNGKLPSMWAEGQWKVFLSREADIDSAIRYVEENPLKEGKPRQDWPFVTRFGGLEQAGWVTYH